MDSHCSVESNWQWTRHLCQQSRATGPPFPWTALPLDRPSPGPPFPWTALPLTAVPLDRPKFRSFFPSPATIYILSSLSWGPFVEFWWCLKLRDPQMCSFGLSGCRVKPRRPHQTGARPTLWGPQPSGPHPSGLHFFWVWAPTRAPPFGAPHPSGPQQFGAPTLRGMKKTLKNHKKNNLKKIQTIKKQKKQLKKSKQLISNIENLNFGQSRFGQSRLDDNGQSRIGQSQFRPTRRASVTLWPRHVCSCDECW